MELKDTLNVALVQTDLFWEDVPANLGHLEEQLATMPHSVDLILLPEMFSTGFTMEPDKVAEPLNLHTTRWMQQIALQNDALVVGSFASREGSKFYNRLLAVEPTGQIHAYDKRHLFRMGGEHLVYTGGSGKLIVTWKGWRICPLVCYDLRFPVWSRRTNEENYDLLLYVANWPAARAYAWDILLRARAIENQAFVAAANRIGTDANGVDHSGGSVLLDFLGQSVLTAGSAGGIRIGEISLSALRTYRERFPAHMDADPFQIHS
jgi:omega-amidase